MNFAVCKLHLDKLDNKVEFQMKESVYFITAREIFLNDFMYSETKPHSGK